VFKELTDKEQELLADIRHRKAILLQEIQVCFSDYLTNSVVPGPYVCCKPFVV